MNTNFYFVIFFNKPEYADDILNERNFANRLSCFKQGEDEDRSSSMDLHEERSRRLVVRECTLKGKWRLDIDAGLSRAGQWIRGSEAEAKITGVSPG